MGIDYKFTYKIIDSILLFMLVFSTGGLPFVYNRNPLYALFFLSLFIAFVFFGKKILTKLFNITVISLVIILILLFVNYVFAISEQESKKYFYYFMVASVAILTFFHFKNNRNEVILIDRLYFVLKMIMIHAGLSFLAYFFVKSHLFYIMSQYHENETFYYLFFYSAKGTGLINLFGIEFHRNAGLFWEAGILQLFLNLFFFLEAFIVKRNKLLLFITALILITTYSTAGIAILLIQGMIYIIKEFPKNKILAPLALLFLIPVYIIFTSNLNEKVYGEKEASFQKRLFDLTQPFFIALEHPLTGIGLDMEKFQEMRQEFYISSDKIKFFQEETGIQYKVESTSKGSSNSIMFLLAAMGFPSAIFLLYMFFTQQIIFTNHLPLMIILVVSAMSEPLFLRPFFFFFVASGLYSLILKFINNRNHVL